MSPAQDGSTCWEGISVKPIPAYSERGIISLISPGCAQPSNRIRFEPLQISSKRDMYLQRDKSIGTDSGKVIRVLPTTAPKDIHLDNDIGEVLHKVKAKFGKAPFIEAYKKALNSSYEINDRRKKCLEEEVRLRSVLRAGED